MVKISFHLEVEVEGSPRILASDIRIDPTVKLSPEEANRIIEGLEIFARQAKAQVMNNLHPKP